jgi:hypothetical protein
MALSSPTPITIQSGQTLSPEFNIGSFQSLLVATDALGTTGYITLEAKIANNVWFPISTIGLGYSIILPRVVSALPGYVNYRLRATLPQVANITFYFLEALRSNV